MATTTTIAPTGNQDTDGLLYGRKWSGTVTYSFPDSTSDYTSSTGVSTGLLGTTVNMNLYGGGELQAPDFGQVSAAQQQAAHAAMGQVAAYTNLSIEYAGTDSADIRIAQSSMANPTAYSYYPGSNAGGDVWFGTQTNYQNPVMGNYAYLTHLHEIGHALGLKHAHEAGGVAGVTVPAAHDGLEYTVMSYRSYIGGPAGSYSNETYGYPTTYMMNDIRALQEMYGADYTTNGGNTVYTWNVMTGEFSIDGVGQGQPGGATGGASANNVFMTVWDGGGNDTYNFSNYTTGVTADLNPGSSSITSSTQLAYLGGGQYAHGNVYNAYLFNGDARSYIENAVGGSGADKLIGNPIGNRLDGGGGADILTGGGGDDTFVFSASYGSDVITDFTAGGTIDEIDLSGYSSYHQLSDVLRSASQVGANTVVAFGAGNSLTLQNVSMASLTASDFIFTPEANRAPTAITLAKTTIQENLAGGTIGALAVSDPDGDTAFTFTTSDARFQVTGGPGAYQLALASGVALDYETERSVNVAVTAADAEGLSATQTFTIGVVDMPGATITGSSGNDIIDGTRSVSGQPGPTAENDVIRSMGGNDTVHGLAGDDAIDGGTGNDALYGDAGNDALLGGAGTDRLDGGAGNDALVVMGTGDVSDVLVGGTGTDTVLVAGTGSVTLAGFNAATASVEAWAGNGAAVLGTTAANTFDFGGLTSMSGIAYVDGSSGDDALIGSRFADDLRGGAGIDGFIGGAGDDRLTGGAGNDLFGFVKGHGHDTITDFVAGSSVADRIQLDDQEFANFAAVKAASHQVGNDVVISTDSFDSITLSNVDLDTLHQNDFVFV
jgi:Ca2+-binding RTX toxin-like protein